MMIKVGVSMGLQGCKVEAEIEVAGETDEEIEGEVREWALEHVDWWYEAIT